MTLALQQHDTNVVLGAGEIYFDRIDAGGAYTGERYLGDSVGATLSVTSERTTIQSGDGAVAQNLIDVVRSVSRTMGFTLRDSSVANWALFLIGDDAAVTIAATEETEVAHGKVAAGAWAQVGRSPTRPNGVGTIAKSGFAAKDGSTAIAANAIYYSDEKSAPAATDKLLVDLPSGRVQALGRDIADLKITFTPVASTKRRRATATTDARQIEGALRYVEDNPTAGTGRTVYIRLCNLVPGGETALKSRDTEQQLAFTATIQDPTKDTGTKYPAIAIDGDEI